MSNRKTILYLMFIIITIILIYNYAVNPLLMQYSNSNMSMHMGMNRDFYNNYNNSFGVIYFLAMIFLILVIILIIKLIFSKEEINKCSKCGYKIEDTRWRRCPVCGNNLGEKRK